jgi:undecaprenyl-diphosphatase
MDVFHAVVLGVVEGLTEFLPVSSTGHLILAAEVLGIPPSDFLTSFEVIIQLGAILAIVWMYIRTLLNNRVILMKLLAAFLPSAVVGLVFYDFIKSSLLGNSMVVVWTLILGGVFLIIFEKWLEKKTIKSIKGREGVRRIDDVSYRRAVLIGVFQAVSVVPGVSRAGATIVGGMISGLDRRAAVEFSFLLAVPTMFAATGLDLVKSNFGFSIEEWVLLAVGFVTAFVTALTAVRFFIRFVEGHTFIPFGFYRIIVGLVFWVLLGS